MKQARSDDRVSPARLAGSLKRFGAALGVLLTLSSLSSGAAAQEPAACLSPNPADWPDPSKPYFMIAFDTSGSMTDETGSPLELRLRHPQDRPWALRDAQHAARFQRGQPRARELCP